MNIARFSFLSNVKISQTFSHPCSQPSALIAHSSFPKRQQAARRADFFNPAKVDFTVEGAEKKVSFVFLESVSPPSSRSRALVRVVIGSRTAVTVAGQLPDCVEIVCFFLDFPESSKVANNFSSSLLFPPRPPPSTVRVIPVHIGLMTSLLCELVACCDGVNKEVLILVRFLLRSLLVFFC